MFYYPEDAKETTVRQEVTWEDVYWAGCFDWLTIFQPADGRKRDARGLTAQSNWILQDHAHILWCSCLTGNNWRDWPEKKWGTEII